jgi:hypothetical protein
MADRNKSPGQCLCLLREKTREYQTTDGQAFPADGCLGAKARLGAWETARPVSASRGSRSSIVQQDWEQLALAQLPGEVER